MKNISIILLLFATIFSCGEANKKEQNVEANASEISTTATKDATKSDKTGTYLCKVNGNDWYYTSGDGLVSENSSTKVRTATIGFKKQLENGSESIQLEYDVKKNVLNNIWVQLKRPTKDGKIITAFYTQYGNKLDQSPGASLSGTVTLDEANRKASGTAIFTISNDYDQDKLANPEDLKITVTDLKFSGVEYSDTDDLKKLMKK